MAQQSRFPSVAQDNLCDASDAEALKWFACGATAPCYIGVMPTVQEKLETLFAKLRTLPEARQQAALESLSDITEEPYQLSEDELATLRPALARAKSGETAADALESDLLTKPWR
jgi:hypothetical protein